MTENRSPPAVPPSVVAAIKAFEHASKVNPKIFPAIDATAFAKIGKDALRVFPAIQKQMAEQLRSWAELHQRIQAAVQPLQQEFARVAESVRRASAYLESFRLSPEFQRLAKTLLVAGQRKEALDRIGLLPHASTPFQILDDAGEDLRERVEAYYRENWDSINQESRSDSGH